MEQAEKTIVEQLADLETALVAKTDELATATSEVERIEQMLDASQVINEDLIVERDNLKTALAENNAEREIQSTELADALQVVERLQSVVALEQYQQVTPGSDPVGDTATETEQVSLWEQYFKLETPAERTSFYREHSAGLRTERQNTKEGR